MKGTLLVFEPSPKSKNYHQAHAARTYTYTAKTLFTFRVGMRGGGG